MISPAGDITLAVPTGWQLDDPQMCHCGNNTGLLMEEALAGRIFETCAAQMSRESGSKIVSEKKLIVNGHPAIKAVAHTINGDWLIRVYIHKDLKIIVISFVILQDEYPSHAHAVQQSIHSLAVKP